jgi:hypothetical protein
MERLRFELGGATARPKWITRRSEATPRQHGGTIAHCNGWSTGETERLAISSTKSAQPTDRERAMASVEMLIRKREATAAAQELAGLAKMAQGRRRLVAGLREMLAAMRAESG